MPKVRSVLLVDADMLAYQAAFSALSDADDPDDYLEEALDKADDVFDAALFGALPFYEDNDYEAFLTGNGNFRNDVAVTVGYKANRANVEKPKYLEEIRQHFVENWSATIVEGQEADDAIAIRATELGMNCTVISGDKDMLQIPCRHYNPRTRKKVKVTPFEGAYSFWKQMLTGDRADNIKGLKGIGDVKAGRLLQLCKTEADLWHVVQREYRNRSAEELGGEPDDRMLENGRLLWLRRYEGEMWELPNG